MMKMVGIVEVEVVVDFVGEEVDFVETGDEEVGDTTGTTMAGMTGYTCYFFNFQVNLCR